MTPEKVKKKIDKRLRQILELCQKEAKPRRSLGKIEAYAENILELLAELDREEQVSLPDSESPAAEAASPAAEMPDITPPRPKRPARRKSSQPATG